MNYNPDLDLGDNNGAEKGHWIQECLGRANIFTDTLNRVCDRRNEVKSYSKVFF